MTEMQRKITISALALFLVGSIVSGVVLSCDDVQTANEAEPVGGWFCCDLAGHCWYIASQNTQDCGPANTVKWCEVYKTAADGTKTCTTWGEG